MSAQKSTGRFEGSEECNMVGRVSRMKEDWKKVLSELLSYQNKVYILL